MKLTYHHKITTVLIALVMCLGILPGNAFAVTTSIPTGTDLVVAEAPLPIIKELEPKPNDLMELILSDDSADASLGADIDYNAENIHIANAPILINTVTAMRDVAEWEGDNAIPNNNSNNGSIKKANTENMPLGFSLPVIAGENMTDAQSANSAPVADLQPIILNEETLKNGQITTETQIAWLWLSYDPDGDEIEHFVAGIANEHILGILTGNIGFVTQFTEPGSYTMYYYCVDIHNEMSNVLGFQIDVVNADDEEFMGLPVTSMNYTSYYPITDNNSWSYAISSHFKYMNGVASSQAQIFGVDIPAGKTAISLQNLSSLSSITVTAYDANENVVATFTTDNKTTGQYNVHLNNEALFENDTSERYYIKVTGAGQFRLVVGDYRNADYYRESILNITPMSIFKDYTMGTGSNPRFNFMTGTPTARMNQEVYSFTADDITTITLRTNAPWLHFAVLDSTGNYMLYNEASDPDARRTKWTGESYSNPYTYKVKLNTVPGEKYLLLLHNTGSGIFGEYRERGDYYSALYLGDPLCETTTKNKLVARGTGIANAAKNSPVTSYIPIPYDGTYPKTAAFSFTTNQIYDSSGAVVRTTTTGNTFKNENDNKRTFSPFYAGIATQFKDNALTQSSAISIYGVWDWNFRPSAAANISYTEIEMMYAYEIGD